MERKKADLKPRLKALCTVFETCWFFQVPKPSTGILEPLLSEKVGLSGNLYIRLMNFCRHSSVRVSSHISFMFLTNMANVNYRAAVEDLFTTTPADY